MIDFIDIDSEDTHERVKWQVPTVNMNFVTLHKLHSVAILTRKTDAPITIVSRLGAEELRC
jgi:hypothetical protein